ncbi:MAG: hypothetical protein ABS77_12135 [Phenylobacterium sp. SCN 69-14]|nr:MAG: hypothetical protein ABS77_12135 [Phenylobacterium sp. SCN 69-14]
MPRSAQPKPHPLSMRLPDADLAIIDRAARLRGHSRTDFVREAAVRAAEEVLLETTLVRMSPDGFDAFMAAVSGPAAPVPQMVDVVRRAAPWETDDQANGT